MPTTHHDPARAEQRAPAMLNFALTLAIAVFAALVMAML
jgi:hypothetical protein